MKLENVVPWGRSFAEYQKMFSLSQKDIQKKILGCADGPASFNAELTESGGTVVSVDPTYQFSSDQIRSRINAVYPKIMEQMSKHQDDYLWETISSIDALGQIRMAAMEKFLADYETGKKAGRYMNASLPVLPFNDDAFDLALCSHYLFLYSAHISRQQHILSMKELCRVATEVRVYPLLALDGKKSNHLESVISTLTENGIEVSLKPVDYQFQKGATEMLVVTKVRLDRF